VNATAEAINGDLEIEGQDLDEGRLFDVPRVGVIVDSSDPTVLKLALSGTVELDRTWADHVLHYNELRPGREVELTVTAYVAGARKVHRRDSEGDVDSIVETKSLVVGEIHFPPSEED